MGLISVGHLQTLTEPLNIANYGYVFSQPSYLQLALNSVIVSAAAATAAPIAELPMAAHTSAGRATPR